MSKTLPILSLKLNTLVCYNYNIIGGFVMLHFNHKRPFSLVSLFAGAGGLDMGFENVGFTTIWANDIDSDACTTHSTWSSAKVVCGDISKIDFNDIPKSDVIAGGFPCQGFSLAGPRKIDDSRNSLYKYFVKLVEEKQPYAFVAENVKGILTLGNGKIIEAIVQDFSERGYDVYHELVNAADYEVPQDRWRVILFGFRKDLKITGFSFPKPILRRSVLLDALKDVPEPKSEDYLQGSFSSRYMSRNRKRNWDQVSFTIPAMGKQIALHPNSPDMIKIDKDLWVFGNADKTRRLSWQEAALIQTFPKDMIFAGNLVSKYKQIGNAVPVKLAEIIALQIKNILEEKVKK